jgi:hypothetical protein
LLIKALCNYYERIRELVCRTIVNYYTRTLGIEKRHKSHSFHFEIAQFSTFFAFFFLSSMFSKLFSSSSSSSFFVFVRLCCRTTSQLRLSFSASSASSHVPPNPCRPANPHDPHFRLIRFRLSQFLRLIAINTPLSYFNHHKTKRSSINRMSIYPINQIFLLDPLSLSLSLPLSRLSPLTYSRSITMMDVHPTSNLVSL